MCVCDGNCRLGRDPQRNLNKHKTFDCHFTIPVLFEMNKMEVKTDSLNLKQKRQDDFDSQAMFITHS